MNLCQTCKGSEESGGSLGGEHPHETEDEAEERRPGVRV